MIVAFIEMLKGLRRAMIHCVAPCAPVAMEKLPIRRAADLRYSLRPSWKYIEISGTIQLLSEGNSTNNIRSCYFTGSETSKVYSFRNVQLYG